MTETAAVQPAMTPRRARRQAVDRHPRVQRGGRTSAASTSASATCSTPIGLRLGDHLRASTRPPTPPRSVILALREQRPAGQDAALLAPLRPARGDARRAWRPRHGDAVVVIDCDLQDPPELIADMVAPLARGLRRRLRPAPHARGRDAAQAHRRRARLPRDQARRRGGDPAEHRRLPADEPARRRPRRRARRGARLPARARRASSASGRRACSTTATRAPPATSKYNRFSGSLVIGLNGDRRLLALSAAPDLAGRDRALGVRVPARDRLPRAQARRRRRSRSATRRS